MLGTILNLFGRSPFAPLETHMEKVSECVYMITPLFEALESKNSVSIEQSAMKISELEHQADMIKNDIRNHLPKSLFLPIDRSHLLEILNIQDSIADKVEDAAVLANLKPLEILTDFKAELNEFLKQTIKTFEGARLIIRELHELLESSFGGIEAAKVRTMVEDVAFSEHEVDLIQRKLLKKFFEIEGKMSFGTFHLWQKIFESIAAISNLSENLAFRVRMTLELK